MEFLGCVSAFLDSLFGELNSAILALRRLENRRKGSGFAHEMTLDTHRYGALIVLDRWSEFTRAFGPHLGASKGKELADAADSRVRTAEEMLKRANELIDRSEAYSQDLVEACVLAFQSLQMTFDEERKAAEQTASLGPMLPEKYREARQIFLEDLAAR